VDKSGGDFWLYKIGGDGINGVDGVGGITGKQLESIQAADCPDILQPGPAESTPHLADPDTLNKVYRALLQELPLSSLHQENLRKRGLSDDEIKLRGYRTLAGSGRSKIAKNIVGQFGADVCRRVPGFFMKQGDRKAYWTLAGASGIIVPLRDALGRIIALKTRADKPGDGPKYSYLTSSGRAGAVQDGPSPMPTVHLPVHSSSSPQNSPQSIKIVRLTEGELKADIATVLSRHLTIAIPGVSTWRPALPVLRKLAPEKVLLSFDADARKNYNVARALQNTTIALQTEGFDVEIETWSEEWGKGIDDVLASGFTPKTISGREQVSSEVNKIAAGALAEQLKEQEKKAAFAALNPFSKDTRKPINADYQDLVYQKKACWEALKQQSPPLVFARGGGLVRIKHTEDEGYIIDVLRVDSLRNIIADITKWYKTEKNGSERSVFPVLDTIKGLLSEAEPPVPRLRRIVHAPVFASDGTLITKPGYHEKAQTWHDKTCDIPAVPARPTKADIAQAKALFFDDLFVDFPFTCDSDKAYSIAAALLPFCRQMINGPTPLHLIDAKSGAGTGKSLLADMITIPAVGQPVPGITEARDDDEWRKRITAKLLSGPTFFLIDNINRKMDSGGLSAALTSRNWGDRLLGESKDIAVPVECVWLATGNSVRTSREIARRLIKIKMDARMENPWARTEFKHKSLREWAMENRGRLVWAALTLIQAWIVEGMPKGTNVLGTFEQWARVMGGILDVAEVPGFLANLHDMHIESDEETEAWHGFLDIWWQKYRGEVVTAGILYSLAVENDLLLPILGGGTERAQKTILGSALGRLSGRKFGEFEVVATVPDRRSKIKKYMLERIDEDDVGNGRSRGDRVDYSGEPGYYDGLDDEAPY
jgi:hypothetical protein